MPESSRYTIGIDLGTTNSVVAYVDHGGDHPQSSSAIQIFPVPQLVSGSEVRALPTLPSFLYFPDEVDFSVGGMKLPWNERPDAVVGILARDYGALVPGRQVSSAKSWLCHDAVDRRSKLLPWGAEPPDPMISPVEASARYLIHLRDAWDHTQAASGDAGARFGNQEIVLTIPASFDEEARELTVEAARQAGLDKLTLLEEPLAAFYAWIAGHQDALNFPPSGGKVRRSRGVPPSRRGELHDGELVLICDVGGGTSDFSLIRVRVVDGQVQLQRTAIGEHLLLGGDNLDLALARRVEERLQGRKLGPRQSQALRRACCAAKERLLSEPDLDRLPISLLGSGRYLVGGTRTTELTRDEVFEILSGGFLPLTAPADLPVNEKRVGLRELGLPYASDPAITRHLASFLARAAAAAGSGTASPDDTAGGPPMARPDAILFNGGFFAPAVTREKVVEAVAGWFKTEQGEWRPRVLTNQAPESSVAIGAAYYGRVRRVGGLRIRAGSARTYYIGVQAVQRLQAVCVLPAGVEEGTTLPLANREFAVLTNRPVTFTLYSSTTRREAHGELAIFDKEEMHRHAPLVTLLRFGKKSRQLELGVQLTASFTEVGTLELWCESLKTQHRWRLQFELRGDPAQTSIAPVAEHAPAPVPKELLESAEKLLRAVFGPSHGPAGSEEAGPETIMSRLESALGRNKDSWPAAAIRKLCDTLAELGSGRAKSRRHEARWLNLFGFCLRPGFGALLDDWRINQARRFYMTGLAFPSDLQCQVEWLVLWRRVAGGFNAGQQHELYQKYASLLGAGKKKTGGRQNSQVEHEGWRLLASLEHLPAPVRAAMGEDLLVKIKKEPDDKAWLWSLGRLGARIPLYGPLNCVVAVETASEWLKFLLDLPEFTVETASAVVQLGSLTNDPLRDIDGELRQGAIARLSKAQTSEDLGRALLQYTPPAPADAMRIFGESLPEGLRIVGEN
jgi:molecular chaperone DnaK (HSP70)